MKKFIGCIKKSAKKLPLTGMVFLTLISIINNVCIYAPSISRWVAKNQLQKYLGTIYGDYQMVRYKILCKEYKTHKIIPALGRGWICSDLLYGNTRADKSFFLICHYSALALGYNNIFVADGIDKPVFFVEPSAPFLFWAVL